MFRMYCCSAELFWIDNPMRTVSGVDTGVCPASLADRSWDRAMPCVAVVTVGTPMTCPKEGRERNAAAARITLEKTAVVEGMLLRICMMLPQLSRAKFGP